MTEIGKNPIDAQDFHPIPKFPLYTPRRNTTKSRFRYHYKAKERTICEQGLTILKLRREISIANNEVDEDHLTGLKNRRWYDKEILRQIALSERNNSPLWMLFMDIDDFKKTNTQYGHSVGDRILQQMAQLSREGEPIVRVGGEEFVQLFFDILTSEKIQAINHRYQASMLQLTNEVLFNHPTIIEVNDDEKLKGNSLSLGITRFIPGEQAKDFYERANQAMHTAKHEGKARIIIG